MIEKRDAQLLGFVGKIAGDAGAGEYDHACRHDLEHAVVALEVNRLTVGGLNAICITLRRSAQHAADRVRSLVPRRAGAAPGWWRGASRRGRQGPANPRAEHDPNGEQPARCLHLCRYAGPRYRQLCRST